MPRLTLAAQILWRTVLALVLAFVAVALLQTWLPDLPPWFAPLLVLPPAIGLLLIVLARWWSGVAPVLRALHTSVDGLRDGDFSFSLRTSRRDELGQLVGLHNRLGAVLRDERVHLKQRELLLDTIVSTSPLSLVLVGPTGHVVMANLEARQAFGAGRPLEGHEIEPLLERFSPELLIAVQRGGEGLVSVPLDGADETFHVSVHEFNFNARPHQLLIVKRLTREIARQELETWKKVIRVISHELNNSMAPIKSLAYSSLHRAQTAGDQRLEQVFRVIGERADHLMDFLQGYVALARLPPARPEAIDWPRLLDPVATAWPCRLRVETATRGWGDAALLQQAVINLLKNAHESGSPKEDIELAVRDERGGHELSVADRGGGIERDVLERVLVAFFSTKSRGSGVGLPLVRDIVEAHRGKFDIARRPGGGTLARVWLPARPEERNHRSG